MSRVDDLRRQAAREITSITQWRKIALEALEVAIELEGSVVAKTLEISKLQADNRRLVEFMNDVSRQLQKGIER
jgi:hypothetical protein